MGRFYTREMGLLTVLGAVVGLIIARLAGIGVGGTVAITVGGGLVLTLMIGPWIQDFLVGFYSQRGMLPRALDLAIKIRDSAPTRSLRSRANVDLALVQVQLGDASNALRNLEEARLSDFSSPAARAVIQGHQAYCLALTGGDLAKAEGLAREARTAVPDEGLFAFYLGLVLLKAGKPGDAEPLIAESLKTNPDARSPVPGERHYFLALARKQLARDFKADQELAKGAGGSYGALAQQL